MFQNSVSKRAAFPGIPCSRVRLHCIEKLRYGCLARRNRGARDDRHCGRLLASSVFQQFGRQLETSSAVPAERVAGQPRYRLRKLEALHPIINGKVPVHSRV
jgi:hypothetical protein